MPQSLNEAPDDLDEDDFDEDLDYWRAKLPAASDDEILGVIAKAKDLAATVGAVLVLDLFSDAWETLEEGEAQGLAPGTFADILDDKMAQWGAGEDGAEDASAIETVTDANLQNEFNEARHDELADAADEFPFWEYVSEHDERVCPICEACDGTILPANDPWWDTHTPSMHLNCRCAKVPLSPEEAASKGVDPHGPTVDASPGWGSTILDYEPDLTTRPPELVHEFHRDQKDSE